MAIRYDWDRDGTRNKLYGRKWRNLRGAFLAAHPLCAMCERSGLLVPATVVDHKVPHNGNELLFWDQGNWQPLCEHHHNSHKAKIEIRGFAEDVGDDGWPIDPQHPANTGQVLMSGKSRPDELKPIAVPVLLVCGAPGSGKTTWCKEQMTDGDVLIDFDAIDGEINGTARRASRLFVPILRERNVRLLKAAVQKSGRVLLPMMAARKAERDWWRAKLGNVSVVMMKTPEEVCIDRIKVDEYRRFSRDEQIETAKRWWTRADFEDVDVTIEWGGGASDHGNASEGHPRPHIEEYLVSGCEVIDNNDDIGFS